MAHKLSVKSLILESKTEKLMTPLEQAV